MTTTIDDKQRARIKLFSPGDVVKIVSQGPDAVLLKRTKTAPEKKYKPRLVRRKGELFAVGGMPVTTEDVKKMLEDSP